MKAKRDDVLDQAAKESACGDDDCARGKLAPTDQATNCCAFAAATMPPGLITSS